MIRPDTDDLIAFLNSLVALDATAISALIEARVSCNAEMADHATVQVLQYDVGKHDVGLLGILNGYCGKLESGRGPITAMCSSDGTVLKFVRTKEGE